MSWWSANISQNPLLSEAKRFGRKMIGASKNKRTNNALLVLCGIIYATILIIAIANRDSLNAEYITMFQTFLFCFIVPALTFSAVAGERERRSWDLLIVAPITKTQIILGKFLSAIIVILCVAALLLPLVLICGLSTHDMFSEQDTFASILACETASMGFGIAFSALGIFISSLMNRAFSAQAAIYAALFVWLILWPMLIALLPNVGDAEYKSSEYLLWTHPFMVPGFIMTVRSRFSMSSWDDTHPAAFLYNTPAQLIFYGAVSAIFLVMAISVIEHAKQAKQGI